MYVNGELTAVLESFLGRTALGSSFPEPTGTRNKGSDTPGLWGPVSQYPSSYQFSLGVKILLNLKRAGCTCFTNVRRETGTCRRPGRLVGSFISGT